jgi:uncharacterized protein with beta-barrel porin domain
MLPWPSPRARLPSGFGGVYGGYAVGPVSVRLGAVSADTDTRARRSVLYGLSDSPTGHGGGHMVQGFGEIGYRRAFGDVVPTALLRFGAGPAFLSAGVPSDRDALVAGAGLDLAVAPNASLGVAYTGQVGARARDQAVTGTFTDRF